MTMMMMMQEKFYNENNRSLNYTKIDRCQDNIRISNDECYQQILHSNEHFNKKQDKKIKIILKDRFHCILFVFLILISEANAASIYQSLQTQINSNQPSDLTDAKNARSSFPFAVVRLDDRSSSPRQSYQVYRRYPNPIQQPFNNIPSYSNGAVVKIYDQTNFVNQYQQRRPSIIVQSPNGYHLTVQLRRERQRRAIIDKMVSLFDEDGNGQLQKDELYSMALRSKMFPKFHHYLKKKRT